VILLVVSPQLVFAGAAADSRTQFIRAIDRMMVELAPQNARASATVKKEYRAYLDHMVLEQYASLTDALYNGGLVPLPADHDRFNIRVRTDGPAPIAEKDLKNQPSYIAARPAAIGALLDIASRVESGPLEITSMVRHSEYQDALRTTNSNANTAVPMHTMGLAFDIALVNTPLKTVYEIRDVLKQMQASGDILFIGERKQLVFHVVPHPSRLGYYTEVYARSLAGTLPRANDLPGRRVATVAPLAPVVNTEVMGFHPTDEHAAEWWASAGAHTDLTTAVTPAAAVAVTREKRSLFGRLASRIAAVFSGAVHAARHLLPRENTDLTDSTD
jgi:hypothetical protein